MSDEQRYHDEQWDDLPLPDSDQAWQKMELLLEKEEKRRRVIPFWFWRYAAPALLMVGLAVGLWLWIDGDQKEVSTNTSSELRVEKQYPQQKTTIKDGNKKDKLTQTT